MGVDMRGRNGKFSLNWARWERVFDLGVKFGWRPAGTKSSTFDELVHSGKYDVGVEESGDARMTCVEVNMRGLIDEALASSQREEAQDFGYFSNDGQVVSAEDASAWADALEKAAASGEVRRSEKRYLSEFIAFCRGGAFVIW